MVGGVRTEAIFRDLNPEQRRAVETVRGPVCILAGAGSGKTTTITRRIANQVASGAFEPTQILAVTFTDRAAAEMRGRLAALGVSGVRARTFHSAALAQLHHLAVDPPGKILPSKAMALRQLANSLPRPYRFRPAADLAAEIEWAKNRRLSPDDYENALGSHEPPIPSDLMTRVFRAYESSKSAQGLIDFEDVLERCVGMFHSDSDARDRFMSRYAAFTVDEYQDVNLLQQALLEEWLGGRDDVCVVGDDFQSIYSFTGATPRYLLDMPRARPGCAVIRLERNYRSTPQILDFANRLVDALGGARKILRATRPPGSHPRAQAVAAAEEEPRFVAARVEELHRDGVALEDMAVLYRVNFRSEDYEEAFAAAGIAYQVRDGAFLQRPAGRRLVPRLRRGRGTDVAAQVRRLAEGEGFVARPPDDLGDAELTRQNDLGRFVRLAEEFDDGARTGADFVADLEARFGSGDGGRGVNLLTYHRAKGLEFEAVFLPRLVEGELPFRRAKSVEALAEERRLLYVGMTRAKSRLTLSFPAATRPSRFLAELGVTGGGPAAGEAPSGVVDALKRWRVQRARSDGVPAFVVLHDTTVDELARRRPRSEAQLAAVPGIGPAKLERYGQEIVALLASANQG
jgi:DNA helicase-2/ATP-dependent DNA helicase PcrA